ncbi:MAG: Asp-tRNA(Asn)/Glu-tRNA(Gln) amidotransferase subunit GatC [Cardiobacteriaceae bacterium]|nr:Asp-tRNA(Asn)/Glu-tRNA(Gln) amidotransferase subunit GatC [Cardiobacteriaceae bacterium]
MTNISIDTVFKTANLARIDLSEEEAKQLQEDLGNILNLFSTLNREEISSLPALGHPLEYSQPLRDDVAQNRDLAAVIERNAPLAEDGFITVPKVIQH